MSLWTDAEAAAYLNTSRRHLEHLRYKRAIPFVKIGGAVRYSQEQLDAWIEGRTIASRESDKIR